MYDFSLLLYFNASFRALCKTKTLFETGLDFAFQITLLYLLLIKQYGSELGG